MSIKVNISKAYDQEVKQDYLEHTLLVMGFPPHFTHLIMQCVGSASFSVLVNRAPKGPIIPSRGLRQGDSLSSYLFLLCIEGLVSLLKQAKFEGGMKRIRVCKDTPLINYLLFTNNSLVFCTTERSSFVHLLNILSRYSKASYQCVNVEKTMMVFSYNVQWQTREEISAL